MNRRFTSSAAKGFSLSIAIFTTFFLSGFKSSSWNLRPSKVGSRRSSFINRGFIADELGNLKILVYQK